MRDTPLSFADWAQFRVLFWENDHVKRRSEISVSRGEPSGGHP